MCQFTGPLWPTSTCIGCHSANLEITLTTGVRHQNCWKLCNQRIERLESNMISAVSYDAARHVFVASRDSAPPVHAISVFLCSLTGVKSILCHCFHALCIALAVVEGPKIGWNDFPWVCFPLLSPTCVIPLSRIELCISEAE